MRKLSIVIALGLVMCMFTGCNKTGTASNRTDWTSGPDWSKWGGPAGNFITSDSDFAAEIIEQKQILWTTEVGKGYSAVTVIEDKVYTMGYDKKMDTVYCLDIKSGKEIWSYSYDSASGAYTGTRASVVADEDRLYTVSYYGIINCLNKKDGKLIWTIDTQKEYELRVARWGISSSAVIEGDMLLVNLGESGAAFNKMDGKLIWMSENKKSNGYSSPVVFNYKGKKAVALLGAKKVYGVDLATGSILWSYSWETSYDVNVADPLIFDNKLFLTSSYKKGCVLLDISGDEPVELWRNKNMQSHMTTPVFLNGYIYGSSDDANGGKGDFRCLDPATGEVVWKSDEINVNSFIVAAGKLIILNQKGTLFVAQADETGYTQISRADGVLGGICWTIPVLSKGRLFLRNDRGEVVCLLASAS